jgi:hypothetical protein
MRFIINEKVKEKGDKVKPTSIPEHNRTAEIQNLTKANSATETIFYFMAWPLIMRIFKNWWAMYA